MPTFLNPYPNAQDSDYGTGTDDPLIDPVQFAEVAGNPIYVRVSTGSETRPDTTGMVMWIGGTNQPTNMTNGDLWFAEGDVAPTVVPTITTTSLNSLVEDAAFAQTLVATGTTPMTWAVVAGTLPPGLVLSTGGLLSGAPIDDGAYSFTVTATNSAGNDAQVYSGTIIEPGATVAPTIATTTLNTLTQSSAFAQTLVASGTTPITWAVTTGTIPGGLALSSSGTISGTPNTAGAYDFTVTATNVAGNDTQQYTGTVQAAGPAPSLSVFTDAAPGSGDTIYNDGGSSLYTCATYYSTIAINVLGVRVWNPTESDGTYLNTDLTVYGWGRDWQGVALGNPTFGSPDQSKAETALRVAGEWTDVLFDAPIALNAVNAGVNPFDSITIGVKYGTAGYYVIVTGLGTSSIESAGGDVYLAETGFPRGHNNLGSATTTFYGLDLIYEVD